MRKQTLALMEKKKLNADVTPLNLRKASFLYIDDDPSNLRLVVEIFKPIKDITLDAVADPVLGLDIAKITMPKVILLDINMPIINGHHVLELLRADERTKDIPVIAVSGDSRERDIERAREAGFNDYLTKPLDIDNLIKVIKLYVE